MRGQSTTSTRRPVFVWVAPIPREGLKRRPQGTGLELLQERFGTEGCTVISHDVDEVTAQAVEDAAAEYAADYIILEPNTPARVLLDLVEQEKFADRVLSPRRDASTGIVEEFRIKLPELASKPF